MWSPQFAPPRGRCSPLPRLRSRRASEGPPPHPPPSWRPPRRGGRRGAAGRGFSGPGVGQPPRRSPDPGDPGWDGTGTWYADDRELAAQLYADSPKAADERDRAGTLADEVLQHLSDDDAFRRDM